jgi:hypothetical protein
METAYQLYQFYTRAKSSPEEQVKLMMAVFNSIAMPLNRNHRETYRTLQSVFQLRVGEQGTVRKSLFEEWCDKIFGPVVKGPNKKQIKCFLSLAEDPKRTKLREALVELMSPSSKFYRTLQELSSPLTDQFRTCFKQGKWKSKNPIGDDDLLGGEQANLFAPYGIPLSNYFNMASKIVGSDPLTDLSTLKQDEIPPILLIPFWRPRMVEIKMKPPEETLATTYTCTACLPLPYLQLRMLIYLLHRASAEGCSVTGANKVLKKQLLEWKNRTGEGWLATLKYANMFVSYHSFRLLKSDRVRDDVLEFPTAFQIYERWCQETIQSKPSTVERLIAGTSFSALNYNTDDMMTALMMHAAPALFVTARDSQPENEHYRKATTSPEIFAQMLYGVPYMRRLWESVASALDQGKRASFFPTLPNFPTRLRLPKETAADCVAHSKEHLYRLLIQVIRQCFITFRDFPLVAKEHIVQVLKLWSALLSTEFKVQPPLKGGEYGVLLARRYEAFSVLLYDFFDFSSTFARDGLLLKANLPILQEIQGILQHFTAETTLSILKDFSEAAEDPAKASLSAPVGGTQCLYWGDEGIVVEGQGIQKYFGTGKLVPVLSRKMGFESVATFLAIKQRLASQRPEDTPAEVRALTEIHSLLKKLYPEGDSEASRIDERVRTSASASPSPRRGTNIERKAAQGNPQASPSRGILHTTDHLRDYLSGKAVSDRFGLEALGGAAVPDVRFEVTPDSSGYLNQIPQRANGSCRSSGSQPVSSNEFPIAVTITEFLDQLIEWGVRQWYACLLHQPRGPGDCGHPLVFTPAFMVGKRSCSLHPQEDSYWYCNTCNKHFGVCCGKPRAFWTGRALERLPTPTAAADVVCAQCFLAIPSNVLRFGVVQSARDEVLCGYCAASPPRFSTRFLAHHFSVTVLVLFIAAVFYVRYIQ